MCEGENERRQAIVRDESTDQDVFTKIVGFFPQGTRTPDGRGKSFPVDGDTGGQILVMMEPGMSTSSQDEGNRLEHVRPVFGGIVQKTIETFDNLPSAPSGDPQSVRAEADSTLAVSEESRSGSTYGGSRNSDGVVVTADDEVRNDSYSETECEQTRDQQMTCANTKELVTDVEAEALEVGSSFITRMSLLINAEIQLALDKFDRRESTDVVEKDPLNVSSTAETFFKYEVQSDVEDSGRTVVTESVTVAAG